MKKGKKRRHRRKAPSRAHKYPASATVTDTFDNRSRKIWHDLLKGLLFIALVSLIKIGVERTTFGRHLELMSYNWLQLQLASDRVPVTIVDISDLEPQVFNRDGHSGKATPRDSLRQMIEAIADQGAKTIGVDVDFSPDEDGYIHPRDPEFFQFCLDMSKQRGVPVFLGIKRTIAKPAAEWLGSENYQGLAANILIPKDSKRMVNVIKMGAESKPGAPADDPTTSKAMSVVLADAYGREPGDSPGWFQRTHESVIRRLQRLDFIERTSEKRLRPGLSVEDFLVDFSPLESIEPLRTINPVVLRDQSQRQRFQDKVVLIGDATLNKATDTFVVPAREQPYPGVFLHACAAYTLIKVPLYEVTGKGRLGIDILFLLIILLTIVSVRLYFKRRTSEEVATHRLQGFLTLGVVLVAIVVGVFFVRLTRVMWDDFFLVLAFVVFHPFIERQVESVWQQVSKHAPAIFHGLVFKKNKETRR
jgi:CHASE2 domain-containing sensor protein